MGKKTEQCSMSEKKFDHDELVFSKAESSSKGLEFDSVGQLSEIESGILNRNWARHRRDPDNWIVIPEFNLLPEDVGFEGFRSPIFGKIIFSPIQTSIWEMVKAVRIQARRKFQSLADLNALYKASCMKSGHQGNYDEDLNSWTSLEYFAAKYVNFFKNIETCLVSFSTDKFRSIGALAQAGNQVAGMMLEEPLAAADRKKLSERKVMLSNAGVKGSKVRHAPFDDLRVWASAETKKMKGHPRNIARQLSNMLPDHLKEVSKDPHRIIYEMLLKETDRSKKKIKSGNLPVNHALFG